MSVLRRPNHNTSENSSDTARLEAFSDGVFAIAITLLILEIHAPTISSKETAPHLAADLLSLWPKFAIYVLSFVNVGIYWANHHYIFKLYRRTDHVFNLINVFFLMCISFVPLPTAVLGEHMLDPLERRAAIIFYGIGLLLPAMTWSIAWMYASSGYRLIDDRLAPKFVRSLTWQYMFSNFVYIGAILCAVFHHATLGLAIEAGITFLYLMPPKKPLYRRLQSSLNLNDDDDL